ncbi:MAG: hypothetical protein EOO27_02030 [Comamonadaceae bacterium]|nr:MAG: hypothetical protein EOO27_02030 [Comamonadaceae bacterium]
MLPAMPDSVVHLNRRQIHRAALLWALAGWSVRSAQARLLAVPRWRTDPFALGVASGQPRSDGFVLWTRLMVDDASTTEGQPAAAGEGGVPVQWTVFEGEGGRLRPVRSGEVIAWSSHGYSVHVRLEGLRPGRAYHYRFDCGGASSAMGRTRTAPAPDASVDRLRLALASCQHYEQGFFAAHRDIAQHELDAVLFVGDYIYEGSSASYTARRHGSPTPHSLDDYRARHALYKRDPDLQAAHAAHPWIVTLDDHEVVNDYAADRDPAYTDPARFLRRRAAAYRAYFEHMPLAVAPVGSNWRLHDRFEWGRLAELSTLDTRQYRSHHACADPARDVGRSVIGCAELADPGRTLLGAEQARWLATGLAASRRRWNLVAQATQMSATGIDSSQGRSIWTDGWDGYPLERRRLLQAASDAGVRNLVTLGGDVHRHVAADLRIQPNELRSPVVASEFVGCSVTSRGASQAAMARMQRDNPDIRHARGDERGWALLHIGPQRLRCDLRSTPHPVAPDATLSVQASFVIEAGRAGVLTG